MARKPRKRIKLETLTDGTWSQIEHEWKLDPKHKMLVAIGRQAWARWTQLRMMLDKEGIMVKGRWVSRVNPLVGAEARARENLVKILAAFDFGGDDG